MGIVSKTLVIGLFGSCLLNGLHFELAVAKVVSVVLLGRFSSVGGLEYLFRGVLICGGFGWFLIGYF